VKRALIHRLIVERDVIQVANFAMLQWLIRKQRCISMTETVKLQKCACCGDPILPQEHHLAYGSQPCDTKIPFCNECHLMFTNSHHLETWFQRQTELAKPYTFKNHWYKRNPRAKFRPTSQFKQTL
jgi:hypothetical protein